MWWTEPLVRSATFRMPSLCRLPILRAALLKSNCTLQVPTLPFRDARRRRLRRGDRSTRREESARRFVWSELLRLTRRHFETRACRDECLGGREAQPSPSLAPCAECEPLLGKDSDFTERIECERTLGGSPVAGASDCKPAVSPRNRLRSRNQPISETAKNACLDRKSALDPGTRRDQGPWLRLRTASRRTTTRCLLSSSPSQLVLTKRRRHLHLADVDRLLPPKSTRTGTVRPSQALPWIRST